MWVPSATRYAVAASIYLAISYVNALSTEGNLQDRSAKSHRPQPQPSQHPLPKSYGILLYTAFEALDVFGPLEAFNNLATDYQISLALMAETMNPVTTRPVTPSMNPKNSSFVESVVPTHTFATAPPLNVLSIPGGLGSRNPALGPLIDFVAAKYPSVHYLITVCTGAGIAARAGVLDGKRATTNKAAWASTVALGPKVKWVPRARWTTDGNVWTSSGISAGIDVTLAFIENVYIASTAERISNLMGYERNKNPHRDPFAEILNVPGE